MIDRSTPVLFLHPKVLLGAAGVSGGLFSALLLASLICAMAGYLAWAVCWLIYILIVILGYALVLAAGGLVGAGGFAIAGQSKGKDGGAGCGLLILLGVAFAILYNGWPWMARLLIQPRTLFVGFEAGDGWDDYALDNCLFSAEYLVYNVFIYFRVYIFSWTVLLFALLGAAVNAVGLVVAWLETPIKKVFHRIRYRCKVCGNTKVQYQCTGIGCAAWHDDLRPSVFGLFAAQCSHCKTELPTTDFGGRWKLNQACANRKCASTADANTGRLSEYHLALVGAQSSGKSCLLIGMIMNFFDFAKANNLALQFSDAAQKREFDAAVLNFKQGRAVNKTGSRARPLAFTLDISSLTGARSRIYLYDAAGEDFEAGDLATGTHGMSGFDFFDYVDGIFFVVDPLAEEFAGPKQAADNAARVESSHLLARLLPVLERKQRTLAGRKIPVPIAVVLTKADSARIPNNPSTLLNQLSAPELSGRCVSLDRAAAEGLQDLSVVRSFLQNVGAADVVQLLESSFFQVGYFAVSALGHTADPNHRTEFRPLRVIEPLVWLGVKSQALPSKLMSARAWQNATDYLTRALRGQEGTSLQLSVWGMVLAIFATWSVAAWYVGGPLVSVAAVLIASAVPATLLRYKANGSQDLTNAGNWFQAVGEWFMQSLRGQRMAGDRIKAILVACLLLATIGALTFVIWNL